MAWYENAARLLQAKRVSRAAIGRKLNITGQAVTLKLQGRRPTTVSEAKIFADFAGVSVAEMLGEEAYLIEAKTEIEMVELFRLLTPAQQLQVMAYARFVHQSGHEPPPR